MKHLKINSLVLGFALLAILFTSCKTDETTPKTNVSPTKLELTLKSGKKAEATVSGTVVDLTTIFDVTFTPTNPTDKTVTWSLKDGADDTAILTTVGKLTAKSAGKVTVIATSKAKSTVKGEAEFTIKAVDGETVPVTKVTMVLKKDAKDEFIVNQTLDLSMTFDVTVEPNNATDKAVTWSISDAGNTSATIDGNNLTATTAGTIKVKATAGSKSSADVSITVKAATVPVATVTTTLKTDCLVLKKVYSLVI